MWSHAGYRLPKMHRIIGAKDSWQPRRLAGRPTGAHLVQCGGKTYRVSRQFDLGNPESTGFSDPITATTTATSWTNNLPFTRPTQFLRIYVD